MSIYNFVQELQWKECNFLLIRQKTHSKESL